MVRALDHRALAGMLVIRVQHIFSAQTQHFNMQGYGDTSMHLANEVQRRKMFDGVVLSLPAATCGRQHLTQVPRGSQTT